GMELIQQRSDTEWVMKHPNTGWSMALHAAGANAKDKPLMNHYGWRVSSRDEVDRAQEYLKSISKKSKPNSASPGWVNRRSCTLPILFTSANREAPLWSLNITNPRLSTRRLFTGRIGRDPMPQKNSPAKVTFARVFRTGPWNAMKARRNLTGALSERCWVWNWFRYRRNSPCST